MIIVTGSRPAVIRKNEKSSSFSSKSISRLRSTDRNVYESGSFSDCVLLTVKIKLKAWFKFEGIIPCRSIRPWTIIALDHAG